MRILVDTTPLTSGHAHRGIGAYTRFLTEHLAEIEDIELFLASQPDQRKVAGLDLIHYPFFDLFFPTLPLMERRKRVVTIHDVIPLLFPDHYPVGVKGRVNLKRQRMALKTVSAIITDSETSKKDVIEYFSVEPEKVWVVPLAANPKIMPSSEYQAEKTRRQYGLPKKYLLYVGDINYNKNVPALIKAIKQVPRDVHLVLVGRNFYPHPIPEWQAIETQVAMSDAEERVHFISDLTSDADLELSALYTGAVAYVQPSLYEGFGLPILEAMQAGAPVISSYGGSLSEVLGGAGVMVEPSPETFSLAINNVLSWSKSKRQEMIRLGKKRASDFSWSKTAEQTHQVYQHVLESK